tara:strand:+ start:1967 stop:2500 length:534 start_codon:yes stop_codon:yes gene_type:complete
MILSSTYDAWYRNHHPSVSSRAAVCLRETRARVLGFYTHRLRAVDDKGGNLLLGIYRARNVVVAVSLYSSISRYPHARLPRRARVRRRDARALADHRDITIASAPSIAVASREPARANASRETSSKVSPRTFRGHRVLCSGDGVLSRAAKRRTGPPARAMSSSSEEDEEIPYHDVQL